MSFQFQYPVFAWLFTGLLLLLLLFAAIVRWKKNKLKKLGDPALVNLLIRQYRPLRFTIKFLLLLAAFALGVLAVMNLRRPGGTDGIERKGIDVVFALDVSRSMLAADVAPTRLDNAKKFILQMMDALPDSRVGLVVFAGKAYVQLPLTNDQSAARMLVEEASPDMISVKGTVISEALQESLQAFGEREARYKAVILISDGENHNEEAVDKAEELAQRGLMLNTVGIGSAQGSFIPDDSTGEKKKDENGVVIVSKLNEAELQQLAKSTQGIYVHGENSSEAVKKITAHLAQIEKKVTGDRNLMQFSYYYWWFAGAMLLLLAVELLVAEGGRGKNIITQHSMGI